MSYKIFTIRSGDVDQGVIVSKFTLKGANVEIPAILIGEQGRGRERGVLSVQLDSEKYGEWQKKGSVVIYFAEMGLTRSGQPKLLAKDSADTDAAAICVFRTKIGFRGGNSHTGDRTGGGDERLTFDPFPGKVLVKGVVAQGAAGYMGSGEQLIALVPKGVVFRTGYSGRLYGEPSSHYYYFDGEKIIGGLTWDERCASDIF